MRALLVVLALTGPAMGADLSAPARLLASEISSRKIVRITRSATILPCIRCRGHGLPWGGLVRTYKVGLPWGGLPDYCPPTRAVRRAVVVTKG